MRAIDADELKKCVLKWLPQDPCGRQEKEMPFETDICVSMLMEIEEQPTIQPEQRTWKWIKKYWHTENTRECSACHVTQSVTVFEGKVMYKYCPYCGAKMERGNTNCG